MKAGMMKYPLVLVSAVFFWMPVTCVLVLVFPYSGPNLPDGKIAVKNSVGDGTGNNIRGLERKTDIRIIGIEREARSVVKP